ncbi:MAG: homoserine kinase [Acidimicrobiia bacterium]|nr:homoserine kinase [Acidimicrobiia bacterium]
MIRASAPASSANLGPGFDVLALALDLRCHVEVAPAAAWALRSGGEPADDDALTLVRAAAEAAAPGAGPFAVDVGGNIPVARGLGSSAALIVAVAGAVRASVGRSTDTVEVGEVAASVEGHPDNVAAAAHGGAVMVSPTGTVRPVALHPSFVPVVAVPDERLSTRSARNALGSTVELQVVVRTAARLAFLLEGLRSGDPDLLAEAAGDELHEARRSRLSPLTGALIEVARDAGAAHAAWSGAGPSVLALATADTRAAVAHAFEHRMAGTGVVLQPDIATTGLVVETG